MPWLLRGSSSGASLAGHICATQGEERSSRHCWDRTPCQVAWYDYGRHCSESTSGCILDRTTTTVGCEQISKLNFSWLKSSRLIFGASLSTTLWETLRATWQGWCEIPTKVADAKGSGQTNGYNKKLATFVIGITRFQVHDWSDWIWPTRYVYTSFRVTEEKLIEHRQSHHR